MNTPTRHQTQREAIYALVAALLYLVCSSSAIAFLPDRPGFFGFPIWFEVACVCIPLGFILLCAAVIHFVYQDIPLDSDPF